MTRRTNVKQHAHRARTTRDEAWSHCVVEDPYRRHSERAHGGITRVAVCRCGAERRVEVNAGSAAYGPWTGGRWA